MNGSILSLLMMLLASSMMLVIMPAVSSDYTLGIFGNANMDDTIDALDVEYVRGIIAGTHEATELADANYDGVIDEKDIAQIEAIIAGEEKELTVLDDSAARRPVTISKPVNRVVVLSTYSAEAMKALDAADKLVGIPSYLATEHSLFFPEIGNLATIGSGFNPDLEKLVSLEPDLVIAYAERPIPEDLDSKLPTSIQVIRLDLSRSDLMREDFKKLGYIIDRIAEAEEVVKFYDDFNTKIIEQTEYLSDIEKPRVYIESITPTTMSYSSIGKGTGPDDACEMAGGTNIAEHDGYKTVDPEWVISENPDIIIGVLFTSLAVGYEHDSISELEIIRGDIMSRPELSEVKAIKEGKVYCIALQVMSKPRYFVGVAYFVKWFHPDLFDDLDPKAINMEYLERFQGMPYRGVYAYPSLEEN